MNVIPNVDVKMPVMLEVDPEPGKTKVVGYLSDIRFEAERGGPTRVKMDWVCDEGLVLGRMIGGLRNDTPFPMLVITNEPDLIAGLLETTRAQELVYATSRAALEEAFVKGYAAPKEPKEEMKRQTITADSMRVDWKDSSGVIRTAVFEPQEPQKIVITKVDPVSAEQPEKTKKGKEGKEGKKTVAVVDLSGGLGGNVEILPIKSSGFVDKLAEAPLTILES